MRVKVRSLYHAAGVSWVGDGEDGLGGRQPAGRPSLLEGGAGSLLRSLVPNRDQAGGGGHETHQ